ncbi:disulfide bond formation protein B [Acaricomes phytoseiuli]|uniref:disulfide bond formation protein B n=1 Tax=Acaricomes phytoseiuli TaxID=291968 RepID=UPI0022237055|nr:disulfide bond formation protein B [Acaricomes phytoseiuli]MCW1250684.1 disulfide bond formation protein B [Acaricomes phytoseiuli]
MSAVDSGKSQEKLSSSLAYWGANLFILAYFGVLFGGFYIQFTMDEYPCPFCMLQRYAMILSCIGPLVIIIAAKNNKLTPALYSSMYGMAILSAVAGIIVSTSHIAINLKPGGGYGPKILGFSTYTWAFISFAVVIIFSAVCILLSPQVVATNETFNRLSMIIVWLFFAMVVANLISTVFLEGFNWLLPSNPECYRLIQNC